MTARRDLGRRGPSIRRRKPDDAQEGQMISDRAPALKPAEARQPGSQDAVFRLQKVSKVYRMGESEIHALRDVDLDLHPGEFIVLQPRPLRAASMPAMSILRIVIIA